MISKTYRILAIDDKPEEVEPILGALRDLGSDKLGDDEPREIKWVLAKTQHEADQLIADASPEGYPLILLDLEYPLNEGQEPSGFQGMKFLPKLRYLKPDSTIVVASVFLSESIADLICSMPGQHADGFVAKLAPIDDCTTRIRMACRSAKDHREGRALRREFQSSRRFRMFATFPEDMASQINATKAKLLRIADQVESGDPSAVAAAPRSIRGEMEGLQLSLAHYTDFMESERSEPKECDLAALLRSMAVLNEDRLAGKQIRIVAPPPASTKIRTYPEDLKAALQEVIENCEDAFSGTTSGKERKTEISLDQTGGELRIIVTDTGPGFTAEAIDRMFDRGFTTRGPNHLGIGLYIARRMMNAIGGEIDAHNRKGQTGAEVVLTLRDLR